MKNILLGFGFLFMFSHSVWATDDASAQLGKKTYHAACIECHAPDIAGALKAPAAFDTKAWQVRLKYAKEAAAKSDKFSDEYAYLVYQVKIGKGLMHHHGLCLESRHQDKVCHDVSYTEAIKYMANVHKEHKS